MNILILAAGESASFETAGYTYPKNLVEIAGKPLLQHVIQNVIIPGTKLHVVLRKDEVARFYTDRVVRLLAPEANIVLAQVPTSGAACTALLAVEHINNDEPLLIVNGDQLLLVNHEEMIRHFRSKGLCGGIPVFQDIHPKYSFVKLNESRLVIEAAEKRPISKLATAGRYYFSRGSLFVAAAQQMILKDAHVLGKFYVCPAYNEAILQGAQIGVYETDKADFASLSTPEAIRSFDITKHLRQHLS